MDNLKRGSGDRLRPREGKFVVFAQLTGMLEEGDGLSPTIRKEYEPNIV